MKLQGWRRDLSLACGTKAFLNQAPHYGVVFITDVRQGMDMNPALPVPFHGPKEAMIRAQAHCFLANDCERSLADEICLEIINSRAQVNRPGFAGGSNFQMGWSRYEQDDEQILP